MNKIKKILIIILVVSCNTNKVSDISQEQVLNYPVNDIGIYFYEIFKNKNKTDYLKWRVDSYYGPNEKFKYGYNNFFDGISVYHQTLKNSKFEYAAIYDLFYLGRFVKELRIYYIDLKTNIKYLITIKLDNIWHIKGNEDITYYSDKYYFIDDEHFFLEK